MAPGVGTEPPRIHGLTFVSWLGRGGFADVFLYQQTSPQRRVAVKVLRDPSISDLAVRAFQAEADAMARLEHPHIVPVFATGTTDDHRPYIVMMYYPQPSLSDRIKSRPLGVEDTLRLGIQIGSAVETAHRAGILHRDIKPANVLTNAYGIPGLTDFGIAGRISDTDSIGLSIPWAAPELIARTAPPSIESDVYALAATLWQALTGRFPHAREGDNSPTAMMLRIRTQAAEPTGRPDVPAALDQILLAGLNPDATNRPSSVRELITSLQHVERDLGLTPTVAQLVSEEWGPQPVPGQDLGDRADMTRTHLVKQYLEVSQPKPTGAPSAAKANQAVRPTASAAPPPQPAPPPRPAPSPPSGADAPAALLRQEAVEPTRVVTPPRTLPEGRLPERHMTEMVQTNVRPARAVPADPEDPRAELEPEDALAGGHSKRSGLGAPVGLGLLIGLLAGVVALAVVIAGVFISSRKPTLDVTLRSRDNYSAQVSIQVGAPITDPAKLRDLGQNMHSVVDYCQEDPATVVVVPIRATWTNRTVSGYPIGPNFTLVATHEPGVRWGAMFTGGPQCRPVSSPMEFVLGSESNQTGQQVVTEFYVYLHDAKADYQSRLDNVQIRAVMASTRNSPGGQTMYPTEISRSISLDGTIR